MTGIANGAVSGWGIDGITTFQRGFPLKITYSGSTPLEAANLGVGNIRPDVVPGCGKKAVGGNLSQWFNTSVLRELRQIGDRAPNRGLIPYFADPESTTLISPCSRRTNIGEKMGVEFRTEFFNLFNHPYFSMPATGFGAAGFGVINSTVQGGVASPERLIQFALKFEF